MPLLDKAVVVYAVHEGLDVKFKVCETQKIN